MLRDFFKVVGAEEIWRSDGTMAVFGRHVESPQEALITELGRASRLWPAWIAFR